MKSCKRNQQGYSRSNSESQEHHHVEVNLKTDTVLVLNRSWQAIGIKTVADSLIMMYTGSATALNIIGDTDMSPMKWKDWINLPYDENSKYISTVRGQIKIPKIIVLAKFNEVPKKRPNFTAKNIWSRDQGTCQYTGQKLIPEEANIDHVIPKSRGGRTNWTNCVLSHKDVNARKGNRTPEEAGLKLIRQPQEPKYLPVTFLLKNKYGFPEWDIFLKYE
jgi:5-methylcytosine-specific restriction endonuclease McrA